MESVFCDSDEEVFWGPVTAHELNITWRKMREEKLKQENIVRNGPDELKDESKKLNDKLPECNHRSNQMQDVEEPKLDEIDIGNLSLVDSPKTCFDLLVKSNCLKFIDDDSINEENPTTALSVTLENNLEEVISDTTLGIQEAINSSIESTHSEQPHIYQTTVEMPIGQGEFEKNTQVGGHFFCSRDMILVSDYSIISSDGESGLEEPKTYTVLKPLVEDKIDFFPLTDKLKSETILPVSNNFTENVELYDNNIKSHTLEENIMKEISCQNNLDIPSIFATGLTENNMPSNRHGTENQSVVQAETPGKYSVMSGDQYFDAESDSSVFYDYQVSPPEVKVKEDCTVENIPLEKYENIPEAISPGLENIKTEIPVLSVNDQNVDNDVEVDPSSTLPIQESISSSIENIPSEKTDMSTPCSEIKTFNENDSFIPSLTVNAALQVPQKYEAFSSLSLDFASLNKEPRTDYSNLKADMHYREPEVVESPGQELRRPKKGILKSRQRLPCISNVPKPIIKPPRLQFDHNHRESKINNAKTFIKENTSQKPNPPISEITLKPQGFRVPTATPKKTLSKISSSSKQTPTKLPRSNLYKDIKSPVAGYIRNCLTISKTKPNVDCDDSSSKPNLPRKEKCITPLKKNDIRRDIENINPSRNGRNQPIKSPLKPVCHFQPNKILIFNENVNSQSSKTGENKNCSLPQPNVLMHKGN